ncbi:MAG: protein kinase family protein, partial [Blastocatellia bacterium]
PLPTLPGTILGTANYMSPEQARAETLDGRADVFSLGATLYEMVTGERLTAGATLTRATAVLRGEQEPLRPQARLDHAPKELERIIRKSLRREREERYASAGEMLNDLNALKRRLDNRASRRMVKLSALAILLAALLVAAAARLSINETWAERVMRDGHTAAARRAAFSPDGRLLVSVGEDNKVIVWDFARRERLATFNDHTDWVISVAFSPDGKWFATASFDKTVIVWDAARLEKVATLRGHRGKVVAVAFSPDGRFLASSDYGSESPADNTILWRAPSWEKAGGIPHSALDTTNLLFSRDGRRLIFHYSSLPNTWDLASGQPAPSDLDPTLDVSNAVFSPDGERLVGMNGEGEVVFVDLRRRAVLNRYPAHQDNGRATAWAPDGRLVATGAEHVILWDAVTMRKIAPLEHTSYVWGLAFSPDGRWLVSTHGDGAVLVWDMVERRRAANFNEHSNRVGDVAFSRDGKRIASASEDRSVIVWDAATGRKEMTLAGHTTRVSGVAFAPGDDWLASVDREGNGVIWDWALRQPRQRFSFPPQGPYKWMDTHCLAISPDGRWVVVSHGVYESATGRQVVGFYLYDAGDWWISAARIYGVSFSVDGRWMVLADSGGKLFLWDTATWRIVDRADSTALCVSFSPDGEWLATGEDQGIVRLWSVRPLRYVAELGRHEARVKSVAFSPDGREVVSASDDRTICLWDVGRRKLITRIGMHASPVLAVAFSPDGKQIVSGERDHSVRLYTRRRALWGFQLD